MQNNVYLSMNLRRILLAILLLLPASASAQFYLAGDEPNVRWMQMETKNYRIVYPAELPRKEALDYASALEKYTPYVGVSAGMTPGQYHWGKMPVILHAYTPLSNGSVAWAPRRIDLYTTPEAYSPMAMPWIDQLVIHEQRHVAQMQFGYRKYLKPINYIVGEMWNGAAAGIFADQALLEGDAVVAETALTESGRGRMAEFLNYYRVAFDNGDYRNWARWRYGSFKYPAPNHYALGYMMISGMRYFYGIPSFTKDYYDGMLRNPWPVGKLGRASKRMTGYTLNESLRGTMECYQEQWAKEDEANGPYEESEQITRTPRLETNYTNPVYANGTLYVLKSGKAQGTELITLDPEDGREHRIRPFNPSCSSIVYDDARGRLYWSETITDKRWSLAGESIIRYIDLAEPRKQHDLVRGGRYFTPVPSPDGSLIAATMYPVKGGSCLVVLSADDGALRWHDTCPFQLTETAWLRGDIYALGVDEGGIGLWKHRGDCPGEWTQILAPSYQQVDNLGADDGWLFFESDRSGLRQQYCLDPVSGKLQQISNVKYGGTDFTEVGDEVYFVSQAPMGKMLYRKDAGWSKPVRYDDLFKWKVADVLSLQEEEMARGVEASTYNETPLPKNYSRLAHLIKFHSWAPIYFDYDEISSMSGDFSFSMASLGATGLFQNDLGNFYGQIGYSAFPDLVAEDGSWRHAGHLKATYSGLYPKFEAGVSFNESDATQYGYRIVSEGEGGYMATSTSTLDMPSLSGYLSAWLPLTWNKGGVLKGFIPRVSYGISNSRFNTGAVEMVMPSGWGEVSPMFTGLREGHNNLMQSLSMSLRGYSMLSRGSSETYPRLGIGAEVGSFMRPGMTSVYAPSLYGYVYGYLPGFTQVQGLKLNVLSQLLLRGAEMFPDSRVNCAPRGFGAAVGRYMAQRSDYQVRIGADYAIPVYVGDIDLFGLAYIRNFLLVPHADAAFYGSDFLCSGGIDITAHVPSILGILPFDCTIGVGLDFPYGPSLPENLLPSKPVVASFIFSMDI